MNLSRLRKSLFGYKVDPEDLRAFRTAIPTSINVDVEQNHHHYKACVKSVEGESLDDLLITEAYSAEGIVDAVNDLVLTYKNIPELYRPYLKQSLLPEDPKLLGALKKTKSVKLVKC